MSPKIPRSYRRLKDQQPLMMEAYEKLGEACAAAGPLSEREKALVKIGLSTGARLEGGLHSHVRKALEAGMQPEEIRHAVLLALPTLGLPTMMAALTWAEDVLSDPEE
ncbi:MAG TPA: carboxymuconolactone decarboxylase family protein [Candidatus Polarisedimenticolia bacterium]|jgi:alkylhydroperoxidase/carboxymuconolactone decarboxylase family protein YurZ|nr:carboxymuconolactone decarboxylase family protein [Candidatus Polarisedimenticolia bacterium]